MYDHFGIHLVYLSRNKELCLCGSQPSLLLKVAIIHLYHSHYLGERDFQDYNSER